MKCINCGMGFIVADYNVIKGFLNLVLSDEFWIQEFNK